MLLGPKGTLVLCPSECWACVFLVLFGFTGVLVIVGVSFHLRLIMQSYKDCSADEDERGHDVTTLAGLVA